MNRMHLLLLLVIPILVSGCSKIISENNGNRYSFEPLPFQYTEDGKWGFTDLNGNVIIEPVFKKKPEYFQNGLAIISNDTVRYYINSRGDTIGTYYFEAVHFSDNRALVKDKNKDWVFIAMDGTVVFKPDTLSKIQLQQCKPFKNGMAMFVTFERKIGFLDTNGHVAIAPKYSNVQEFSEGLAYAELKNDTSGKVERYLINTEGDVVKTFHESFEWMNPFNEGMAAFKDSSGCGYLNRKGDVAIAQQKDWNDLSSFINGYASYFCGGDWGVIDSTGKRVLLAAYEIPPLFYNGLAIIRENGKFGVINLKGEKVIKARYHHIAYPLTGDRLYAKDGKYYIMIDKTGKQIDGQEIFRIDLVSALLFSLKTGYLVIGEKLGISVSDINNQPSKLDRIRSDLNTELVKIYND